MSVEFFFGGGRLGRTPVLALMLEQLREQFHRKYLSTAEASKIQMQSTVQDAIVGQPLHGKMLYLICVLFVRTFPRPDWAPPAARPRRRH